MIGVFDSGVGGLSVLRAIHAQLPKADVVYFGDLEHAPYGNKSAREIGTLISMALQRLAAEGATHIVSACNSASVSVRSVPIDLLRIGKFDVIEMVGPTVDALLPTGKKIVLLGTYATVQSKIYQTAFAARGVTIDAIAIPELATLVEEAAPMDAVREVVGRAVRDALAVGAEILSLSCTHFPFVRDVFEEMIAQEESAAIVFDPAQAVAHEVGARFPHEGSGTLRFLISRESSVFRGHVERLFPHTRHSVELAGSIYWALKTS